MSSPPPIIPQTPEQAIQRDQIAGLKPVPLEDPRAELARLQQAVRDHREALSASGPITLPGTLTDEYVVWLERRAAANRELWAHIGEIG
jgi:hypothetical protein